MFTISHTNTEKIPYIRHKSYENLFILPYINCRLVFAEMAVRAIGEGEFDMVVVDLPFFMNDNEWLEIPIESFPLVSSLIVSVAGDEVRDLMKEDETIEFKKSLAELKAGLISIVAMLNKHGAGELWFGVPQQWKSRSGWQGVGPS